MNQLIFLIQTNFIFFTLMIQTLFIKQLIQLLLLKSIFVKVLFSFLRQNQNFFLLAMSSIAKQLDNDKGKVEVKDLKQQKKQKEQVTIGQSQQQSSKNLNSYGYTKKDHPPSKKKIRLNTSHSRGELKLLKLLCKKYDWTEVFSGGNIMWSGLAIPQDEWSLATEMKVNRIPAMPHLCHKKTMGFILNKFREYWPDQFYFYPQTYLLPQDHEKLQEKIKDGKMLIAKPSAGCQGDGISLIKKLSQIPKVGSAQWIVQPYIGNPLLIEKKKFDLRLYVLIASIEPYICFLNEEGLARFCTQDYQEPTQENLKNSYMHLTNYSLNKNSSKYQNGSEPFSRGSKRCLKTVWQDLAAEGINIEQLQQKIITLTQKYLTGMFPFLKYYYHATFPKTKGKCFHVIGIDILIDNELNPWLLQANNNPSFNIEHQALLPGNTKQIKQVSPVDEYVKSIVVEDALFLVNKSIDKLKQMSMSSNFYSFKKILDMESQELKQMNIIENMLKVFHSQCSIRSKWVLTSSQFTKLSQLTGMTNQKLTKNDYHLVFIKVMRQKLNPNQMEFEDFIQAMEYIVKEIAGYTAETKLQVMQQHMNLLVGQIQK